jgi:ABC-type branched-subunit amino acid transport system permease subunit
MLEKVKLPLKLGAYGSIVAVYLCVIGMVETFGQRTIISGVISLGHTLLLITGLATGYLTAHFVARARNPLSEADRPVARGQIVMAGLLAGLVVGLALAIFVIIASQFNLRPVLINVSPALLKLLTLGQGATVGSIAQLVILGVLVSGLGSVLYVLPVVVRQPLLWGLTIVLLTGMLSDLLRITLTRPGWTTTLAKMFFATQGLTVRGAITFFVITIGLVIARPYLPGLYQGLIRALVSWLPLWFRRIFVGLLSLSLLLRLIWFIGIDTKDLPLLPACGEFDPLTCVGSLGETLDKQAGTQTGLASLSPTILVATTIVEMLLAIWLVVAAVWLIVQGLRWRQIALAERDQQGPTPDIVYEARRATTVYISIALLLFIPALLGTFPSEVMVNVGLFMVMGFGLNIVVGFAGLLDLGYVAFFAVGAYAAALLTSPASVLGVELSFWSAFPIVFIMAAIAGLLVGAPVLRMRGDYLAIVTLGLGEIARFLALSDWLRPLLGGAQGILEIPNPTIFGVEFVGPQKLYYLLLGGALVALFISWRLKGSRVGRAWVAMREDEDVADAMGINTVQYKLMAFATGAVIASFSGAVFAAKLGSVFPHSFNVLVSITALSLLIIGGIGSLPGVVVGALALVGIPELLREFTEFRLLIYGAVLIIMMLVRPEGLLPDVQRAQELHEEERAQDAWLQQPQPAAVPASPGSAK